MCLPSLRAAFFLLAVFLCGLSPAFAADAGKVLEPLNRSVVRIFCAGEGGRSLSFGTGFFAGENGDIVTNYHVVSQGAAVAFVLKPGMQEADMYRLVPVRLAPEEDLALMRPEAAKKLPPPLPLKAGGAKVLDRVVAAGFPGLVDHYDERSSRVEGVLAALLKDSDNLIPNITQGAVSKVSPGRITHDATIGHGNSGGPLVDLETGEVVGVNTALASDNKSSFFFAIPVQKVKALLEGKIGSRSARSRVQEPYGRGAGYGEEPMDPAALSDTMMSKLISLHFLNGFVAEPVDMAYAERVFLLPGKGSMSRERFLEDQEQYRRRWPHRHFEILGAARRGRETEVVFHYVCISDKGRKVSGYSRLRLRYNESLQIEAYGEETSFNVPDSFSPGFWEMDYEGPMEFFSEEPQAAVRVGVLPAQAVEIASRRLACNDSGNLRDMEALYAPRIRYANEGRVMARREFIDDFREYASRWPLRRYELLEVGVQGNEVEMVISFECRSAEGKVSRGYSKTRLVLDENGLICGIDEHVSRRTQPGLSPGFAAVPFVRRF